MWSCGVILYILLSGKPPFDGHNDDEILSKVSVGKIDLVGSMWMRVSDEAKELVKKLLLKDPEKRINANDAI